MTRIVTKIPSEKRGLKGDGKKLNKIILFGKRKNNEMKNISLAFIMHLAYTVNSFLFIQI